MKGGIKTSIKQGVIVILDFGLMSLASFAITVLLAKSVVPEEYSLYVLATSLIMMLLSVQKALVITPYTVIAPKLKGIEKKSFQGLGLLITVILLILCLTSLVTYIAYTDGKYEQANQFSLLLSLFCLWMFFYVIREQMRFAILADLKVKAGFLANVTGSALILLVLGGLFIANALTLQTLLYGLILSTAVPSLIMLIVENKNITLSTAQFTSQLSKYWSIGRWNLLNALLYSGANLSIPWLILFYSEKKSVAVYGVCLAFASAANPLLRGVNGYLFPKMSHGYKDKGANNLWRLTRLSILVMLVPFSSWLLVISIWGESLITLFYSTEYAGYQTVLLLIVLKMTVETISTPINSALQTIEKAYIITAALLIGLLITVFVGINLIDLYGLLGAAVLGVISSSIMVLIKFVALKWSIQKMNNLNTVVTGTE